jgi:hypothetical protein
MELSSFLPTTIAIPIDPALMGYLLSDDTRLPAAPAGARLAADDPRLSLQRAVAGDADGGASYFSAALPGAEAAVAAALASLGDAGALPRVCGAAPVDGGWASSRGGGPSEALRCCCAGEVWALLKASGRVRGAAAAAAAAPGAAAPPQLTLQRWLPNLEPARELRCLVVGGALAGVRQRLCGEPPPAAARASARAQLRELLAAGGLAAALRGLGEACSIDVHDAGGAGGLLLLGAGPAAAFFEGGEHPPGRWAEEGEEGEGDEGGGGQRGAAGGGGGALGFHPLAAHGFPAEMFHFAAERVAAAVGGALEPGEEAGGLLSELAAGGGAGGAAPALGGGWQALVASLEARGAFGGADGDSGSDSGEGGGAQATA